LELKSQNFEFEGQSYLFWEYMRVLTDIRKYNPDVKFLLENVMMGEKWQRILTQAIGINPIEINSSLLSAQNRRRLYWTNIGAEQDGLFGDLRCMIPQPKDKGILLKDILEPEVDEKYYLSDKIIAGFMGKTPEWVKCFKPHDEDTNKCDTVTARYAKSAITDPYLKIDKDGKLKANQDKASCFTAGGHSGGNHSDMDLIQIVAMRGRNPENTSDRTKGCPTKQMLEAREDGKTNCITTVQKDNLVSKESRIRRLTPLECCRLQTMKDDYFIKDGVNIVSDSQKYKQIGNGWTIEVISHIFSYLDK
jgi:DNA (cytosine-5)-methyltransferase 3A